MKPCHDKSVKPAKLVQVKLNLKCEIVERGKNRVSFRMLSNFNPCMEVIREMQNQLGFRPLTFGGPWSIKTGPAVTDAGEEIRPVVMLTTWDCSLGEAPIESTL